MNKDIIENKSLKPKKVSNKSINPHQEALAYAKKHNLTTNQAMKVLANRD